MKNTRILVVGGAGYIGSTTAWLLKDAGVEVHIVDNLSQGYRELAGAGTLHEIDLLNGPAMDRLFSEHDFDAVVHFAAYISVGESVEEPISYYRNNIAGTLNLLQVMQRHDVRRLVFSSTAAVYGDVTEVPIVESTPLAPINPYGWSKRMVEQILHDCDVAWGLKSVALRYFNAAGADPQGRCGEWHRPETHLIPVVMQTALGKIPKLNVFGDDYPTPDGTCIRDYIHVWDLADAHRLALQHLVDGGESDAFNLGSERGYSILEVIRTVETVTGKPVPYVIGPRRSGDPAQLVASSAAIVEKLGWQRDYSELERIVSDAWTWHQAKGFSGGH